MKLENKAEQGMISEEIRQLGRFSIVGALNTMVDFAVFTIVCSFLGAGYIAGQAAGYGLGTLNSFIFNKAWTFQYENTDKKASSELLQFIIINIISFFISLISIKLLVNRLNLNEYLSKIIVIFITQLTNFFGYKLWVFKK